MWRQIPSDNVYVSRQLFNYYDIRNILVCVPFGQLFLMIKDITATGGVVPQINIVLTVKRLSRFGRRDFAAIVIALRLTSSDDGNC